MSMKEIEISIAAEPIFHIGSFPVTNTLLMSWIVMAILIVFALVVNRRLKLHPGKIQNAFEMVVEYIWDFMAEMLESKKLAKRFFPLIATLFLFIWVANMIEFTPGIGSVVIHEEGHSAAIPLLRSMNTDLNVTVALAIVAFLVIEVSGFLLLGFFKYGSKFINFGSPMKFFIGLIEMVSELGRLLSFSFRLFGNIFAVEVLIVVIAAFVPFFLPIPFMAFELFVGTIQAAIFALLTLSFIKIAITPVEHH